MKRYFFLGLAGLALIAMAIPANEVSFSEDFALATKREDALKQLIPGTRDYYYYHCLHYQNAGQVAKFEQMLAKWIKRYNYSGRVEQLRNRQALLQYETNPKKSLAFIKSKLGLRFHHQKEVLGRKPNLPTRLNPTLISYATLSKLALSRHSNLRGFNDSALEILAAGPLTPNRRRNLLQRQQYPDISNLAKLVVDDLRYKHSGGFGSHGIHAKMLSTQLDEALALMPELLKNTKFVNTYIAKLRPNPDTDWEHHPNLHQAYLERLEAFVTKLPSAFNSLRAHILYRRLIFDRSQGIFNKPRFMKYLKLPRNVSYMAPQYLKRSSTSRYRANLRANYKNITLFPPIQVDEPLVRDYLMHFFITETSYLPYATFISDTYLKRIFSETKIVNGIGDMEKWYSMLGDPGAYQRLKERVDIDFATTNPVYFKRDDPVTLKLNIKNVKKLIVKVFEINTFNFYRDQEVEVGTDLNLDGLVASEETTHTYEDPPLKRVSRTFTFANLTKPGVYVIEIIGNGRSSRALIRKGRIRYLERLTASGHEFTLMDESNKLLKDATLWMDGSQFNANKEGRIKIPYSTAPGSKNIILQQGNQCTLDTFRHRSETYSLHAGFFVDREALLKGRKAKILVRPMLYASGLPTSLKILEDVSLLIHARDRWGVENVKEIRDFKVAVGKESVYEFQVPKNLVRLRFTLKAKIENISTNKKVDLSDGKSFSINGIDRTPLIEDLHLSQTSGGSVLYLLGKNGEPRAERPVYVTLTHRHFRQPVHASLKTDRDGRVELGMLEDIIFIDAKGPSGIKKKWNVLRDRHSQPNSLNGKAGSTLHVPYMGSADPTKAPPRSAFTLLEKRGGSYVKDHFKALGFKEGFVELKALPVGDYELRLKESSQSIDIKVTDGIMQAGHLASEHRILEIRHARPLQIEKIEAGVDAIKVQLRNHGDSTRVHITATKFMSGYDSFNQLNVLPIPNPSTLYITKADSHYLSGRDIGDEYRYILERKYAKKFPGNMLSRPGLLLNPWALRETASAGLGGGGGGRFGHRESGGRRKRANGIGGGYPTKAGSGAHPNLDFLARPSPLWFNLKADKNGLVSIPTKDLGDRTHIHVVAIDPLATAYRQLVLKESKAKHVDLRLIVGLDPTKHFTEQKRITALPTTGALAVADITTSDVEVYDTMGKVYALFTTLANNSHLTEFSFLLNWPKLKAEEKQKNYSKYACHELNFFLYKKDPEFFKTVIKPYLVNKKDKTFLDHWLLENELARYLEPRTFARLNIVERILLGRRIKAQRPSLARHVKELFHMIPPNLEQFNRLFRTAVQGSALEAGDSLGLKEGKKSAKLKKRQRDVFAMEKMKNEKGAYARAPAKTRAPIVTSKAKDRAAEAESMKGLEADEDLDDRAFKEDSQKERNATKRLYLAQEKTKEWAENNYYHLPISQQEANLVTANAFWDDFGSFDGAGKFLSKNFPVASRNFSEMMFVLSILDLPFEAKKHTAIYVGQRLAFTAKSPVIVFHKEILPSAKANGKTPLLVSQNFFDLSNRYTFKNNERQDKYITDEFLAHTVYGCQVVLTNPTSTARKIDVLLQIPRGALPVQNGFYTRGRYIQLGAYATTTVEYHFYFPAAGEYLHFPVHLAKNGTFIASAKPVKLKVVLIPTKIDTQSWDYVSQHGTPEQVVAMLNAKNLNRLNLNKIAWRMRARPFFTQTLNLLRTRHTYHHTLWSYGILHADLASTREYLRFSEGFLNQCGPYIDCKLATIDPVERKRYEHLEYSPLVNERVHRFGKRHKIADRRMAQQYQRLLHVLSYRPTLDSHDRMAVAYYLLLQDRIEQAMQFIAAVKAPELATQLQYDYMKAYIDFYSDAPKLAGAIAAKYKDHPVDRWRNAFKNISNQLEEAQGKGANVADLEDRDQTQARLAASAKSFEFSVEDKRITVNYQNMKTCQVNYYLMDLELLFSHKPFVQQVTGQFSFVRPNKSESITLPADRKTFTFDLPKLYLNANVMVEIIAGGTRKSQAYYAHSLRLQVIDTYGQVRVTHRETGKPLPKVYVKVYAQRNGGKATFFKDGYTDLRGRFDYSSVSSKSVSGVSKFALLVMSNSNGAVIREAQPPAQ